jgi:hypothetical protein
MTGHMTRARLDRNAATQHPRNASMVPVMRWTKEAATGRPVCRWVMSARTPPARAIDPGAQ